MAFAFHMKKNNIGIGTVLLISLTIMAMGCKQESKYTLNQKSERPNVLFIMVDDLRPELGIYGAKHIHSPNIDKLGGQSIVFERAYVNVPVCGASRASILTGLRPTLNRFKGYDSRKSSDCPEAISMPQYFKQHGYRTYSFGKIYHFADDDKSAWDENWRPRYSNESGFRDYQDKENLEILNSLDDWSGTFKSALPYEKANLPDTAYFDGRLANKTIATLKLLNKSKTPFFLAVGFFKPHLPFNAPTKYWDLYDSTQIKLPANYLRPESTPKEAFHHFGELRHYYNVPKKGDLQDAMARKMIHGYYASLSYADAQVGKILDELERPGLSENTIFVLIGDHGWNLGDHKMWCKHCNFESSLHTPLIIKVPGKKPRRVKSIVEFIDIYPTLLELTGLPKKQDVQGESMAALLQGKNRGKDYAIVKYNSGVTLIKDDLFYTEYVNDSLDVQARMLFDHKRDTLELENLSEHPNYQKTVRDMHMALREKWCLKPDNKR
ncbi:MAG: sulfatase [Bacteroidota bacterium]